MNSTPEYKVVGGNCLADFLRTQTPGDVVSLFEAVSSAISSAEEYEGGGMGGGTYNFGLAHYLGYVAAAIRCDGWMSRGQARNMDNVSATADTAWAVMIAEETGDKSNIAAKYFPTKEDWARGEAALDYTRVFIDGELDKGELNDYLYNLNVACRVGTCNSKSSGLTASIIALADREQGKEIERRKFSNLKETSAYFAEAGDKVVVKATLMGKKELEGQYGCTTMFKFVSEAGNALTWFASGWFPAEEWVVGNEYILAGKVKKNEDYKGLKQTILTRCNVVTQEWVDAEKVKAEKKALRAAKKAAKAAGA